MSLSILTRRIGNALSTDLPLMLLAHGGSFCKETWNPFVSALDRFLTAGGKGADILALDFSGHGDSWRKEVNLSPGGGFPSADVSHVIEYIRNLGEHRTEQLFQPVPQVSRVNVNEHTGDQLPLPGNRTLYAVGHSMGGTAILGVEQRNPGTFHRMVCFEPIVFPQELSRGEDSNLVRGALKRRNYFVTLEDASSHFEKVFKVSVFVKNERYGIRTLFHSTSEF
eukprot:gb/GECG01015796.1/.p1 GENE.gb/GECG01015796.1/~~gb/GECG01015796.1/.p1  ORF type:complete len:224 (+),score=16.07 gb/GECG01015796.1/:1-672(+)